MTGPAGGTWKQAVGGRHRCRPCGRLVDAKAGQPVWVYWLGSVAHSAVCGRCVKGLS